MAAFEENSHSSAIEQMNQLLFEKESVINQKKAELETYMVELKAFEGELVNKTKELQAWQKRLEEEEQKIKEKWEEIKTFEEKLTKSTNEVLAEKVKIEQMNKERLMSELKADTSVGNDSRLDLNNLRASIGIAVPKPEKPKVVEVKEEKQVDMIPEFLLQIQEEAVKAFQSPKNYVIELKPDIFCMKIGEKELRVFDKEPLPEVHLVVNRKNAKNDSKLQRKITMLARNTPDWVFELEDNHLICKMYFTKETKADLVVGRCKECIQKIED